jgi:hypothetical protein
MKVVRIMAAALALAPICLAQQNERSNAIGDDTAIETRASIDSGQTRASGRNPATGETNSTSLEAGRVQTSGAGANDSWRMINHHGTWWYYHRNGNWSTWDGTRWNPYQPATQNTGSGGATDATDSMGLVTGRHSGDVEVSGAQLGMGVGASRNSGLTNNPGSILNGKGGIGGTK